MHYIPYVCISPYDAYVIYICMLYITLCVGCMYVIYNMNI